jgi:hypothetical protein
VAPGLDLGADEHTGQTFVVVEDEDPPLDSDPRSGQIETGRAVHRREHVVDQAATRPSMSSTSLHAA